MSKERPTTGTDGRALPLLPPERDARVRARRVRVMSCPPGFLALLLLEAGEPASFGITVERLTLSGAAAVVGGRFVASQSWCPDSVLGLQPRCSPDCCSR